MRKIQEEQKKRERVKGRKRKEWKEGIETCFLSCGRESNLKLRWVGDCNSEEEEGGEEEESSRHSWLVDNVIGTSETIGSDDGGGVDDFLFAPLIGEELFPSFCDLP